VAKAPVTKRGLAHDRCQVFLRGAQFFVVDTTTSMTLGGPYADRSRAQEQADALNRSLMR
jgi:hypothetical protein